MLWINGAFWVPRRWWYEFKYGKGPETWNKLMQNPSKHWLSWPIPLHKRKYRYGKGPLVDSTGLIWFVATYYGDAFPAAWLKALSQGKVGLDIGAHRGYWSLYHAKFMPLDCEVFLMEASYENYRYLLQNIANFSSRPRFFPIYGAAWHEPARLKIEGLTETHESFSLKVVESDKGEVPAIPIDTLIETYRLSRVDWIKIDVEGAEVSVLEGARQTLQRFGPTLWLEVHDTWEKVKDLLQEIGYCIREEMHRPDVEKVGYLWAEPSTR